MTYIVTGKLRNCTFMISDCIATNKDDNKKTLVDKVIQLSSSENLFFSLTGTDFVAGCVSEYDYWLANNEKTNDFIKGENSIKDLIKVIKIMYKFESDPKYNNNPLSFKKHRLFFITKSGAIYYDLLFSKKGAELYIKHEKKILQDNFYIDSMVSFPDEKIKNIIPCNESEIKKFCFESIKTMIKPSSLEFEDFKNRFSFILIPNEGSIVEQKPHKCFSDIIANHYGVDYNTIDDEDFILNI